MSDSWVSDSLAEVGRENRFRVALKLNGVGLGGILEIGAE